MLNHLELVRRVRGEMIRLAGRDYPRIDLAKFDVEELRDMLRFLQDVDTQSANRARRAQLNPWRRP